MTVLEQLQVFEDTSLKGWKSKSTTYKQNFMDEIVDFANDNDDQFKIYVSNIVPNESSVLGIIYEALSRFSDVHFDFLRQEINRLLDLLVKGNVNDTDLEVLHKIEINRFYLYDYDSFKGVLDDLILKLTTENNRKVNVFILVMINNYISRVVEEGHKQDLDKWNTDLYARLEEFSNKNEKKLILDVLNRQKSLSPISKFSKIALILLLFSYSIFLYSQFSTTLDLSLFNTHRLLILFLGCGFVFSLFFDFSFKIIHNKLLRFLAQMLILGPIGLKIVMGFIDLKSLKFLRDWLYIIS